MNETIPHKEQIARIKAKLAQARAADPGVKAFGAKMHKYDLNAAASMQMLRDFEQETAISLPSDFAAFLTEIGNGGAGPFYGIYALDSMTPRDDAGAAALRIHQKIHSDLTDDAWEALMAQLYDDVAMSRDRFEALRSDIFGGLLVICDQGCDNYAELVLTGPDAGRVVNTGDDRKPFFAFEDTFLDWYERWLDEVISGVLLQRNAGWFGYSMGGTPSDLINLAMNAPQTDKRIDALDGLIRNIEVDPEICNHLATLCGSGVPEIARLALFSLTKFDATRALPHLRHMINADDAACLSACEAVHWYAKDLSPDLAPLLLDRLTTVESENTVRFAFYVLQNAKADSTDAMLPFANRPEVSFRKLALYALGKSDRKSEHLEVLIASLADKNTQIVHAALQALADIRDTELLPAFASVAKRYPVEEGHIRVNLAHRLREFGYDSIEAFEKEYSPRI